MSRLAEKFLAQFNASRNSKEGFDVIDNIVKYLLAKKNKMENLLTEISKSKVVIHIATAATEQTFTTKTNKTKVDVSYSPADIQKLAATWDELVEVDGLYNAFTKVILPKAAEEYKFQKGVAEEVKRRETIAKKYEDTRDKLLSALRANGEKHIPKSLSFLVNKLKQELTEGLANRFEECNIHIYPNVASLKGKSVLAFFCYIQFKGLINDEDWKTETFEVVVIAVPDEKGDLQFQVQTFSSEVLPTQIDLDGQPWLTDVKGIRDLVIGQLTESHNLNLLRPQMIPFSQKDVSKFGALKRGEIQKAVVDGQHFKIYFKSSIVKSQKQATEIGKNLYPIVKRFFKEHSKGFTSVPMKTEKEGTNWVISYMLATPDNKQGRGIAAKLAHDRSAITELGIRLKLTDDGIRKLEESLRKIVYEEKYNKYPKEIPTELKDIKDYKAEDVNTPIPSDRTKIKPTSKTIPAPKPAPSAGKSKLKTLLQRRKKMYDDLQDEDIDI